MDLGVHAIASCDPAHFVRLSRSLLGSAGPALLVAGLDREAVLLGRHQRAASALERGKVALARLPVLRRLGGGRAFVAGEGTVAVALALPSAGALLPAPVAADKVLNRHVRGLRAALARACGVQVAYFGRDFLAAGGRSVALVSQDGEEDGAVLLEAFVGVRRPLALPPELGGYPPHGDPRAAGPVPASLQEVGTAPPFPQLVELLAAGWCEQYGVAAREVELPPPAADPEPAVLEEEAGFSESGVADVAIGFAEALVRSEGERVLEARLRGDFIAPAFAIRRLEEDLAGSPLAFEELGRRVDVAFHRAHAALHGVRHLRVFADAVLAATGRL